MSRADSVKAQRMPQHPTRAPEAYRDYGSFPTLEPRFGFLSPKFSAALQPICNIVHWSMASWLGFWYMSMLACCLNGRRLRRHLSCKSEVASYMSNLRSLANPEYQFQGGKVVTARAEQGLSQEPSASTGAVVRLILFPGDLVIWACTGFRER